MEPRMTIVGYSATNRKFTVKTGPAPGEASGHRVDRLLLSLVNAKLLATPMMDLRNHVSACPRLLSTPREAREELSQLRGRECTIAPQTTRGVRLRVNREELGQMGADAGKRVLALRIDDIVRCFVRDATKLIADAPAGGGVVTVYLLNLRSAPVLGNESEVLLGIAYDIFAVSHPALD